uniref:Uncharacterized protein n=1 Tax=Arundo donax TaxID=35708 RepID=A0A0A9ERT9_ARUDO
MERDHDEMIRSFDQFKINVRRIQRIENSGLRLSYRVGINENADTSLAEVKRALRPLVPERAFAQYKAMEGFP